jgi:hypothetical protein
VVLYVSLAHRTGNPNRGVRPPAGPHNLPGHGQITSQHIDRALHVGTGSPVAHKTGHIRPGPRDPVALCLAEPPNCAVAINRVWAL